MWIFTTSGFFSIVQHGNKPDVMVVRARDPLHIARAQRAMNLKPDRVIETPNADYPYRVEVGRALLARWLADEARTLEYTNFKGVNDARVHSLQHSKRAKDEGSARRYASMLHAVWHVVRNAIDERVYDVDSVAVGVNREAPRKTVVIEPHRRVQR